MEIQDTKKPDSQKTATYAQKVGILTFHRADNFGAVLQAYSLLHVLLKAGYDSEIIDYCPDNYLDDYRIFRCASNNPLKKLIYTFVVLPHFLQLKRKKNRFNEFRKNSMKMTCRFFSHENLVENFPDKDAVISGSDQVFNPLAKANIPVFYLDYPGIKATKIAYAPSFGISKFDDNLKPILQPLLEDFDYLSCREKDGAEYITSLTHTECKQVVDPVFLQDAAEWSKIAVEIGFEQPYILVYDLNGGKKLIEISKRLQKKTNLKIVCITNKKYLKQRYNVDKIVWDAGPREFVSWIKNADYVITDSFHGLSFATIFQKKILSYVALEAASGRLVSLLKLLGVEDKLAEGEVNIIDNHIFDASKIDVKSLNMMIKESKEFLLNALK